MHAGPTRAARAEHKEVETPLKRRNISFRIEEEEDRDDHSAAAKRTKWGLSPPQHTAHGPLKQRVHHDILSKVGVPKSGNVQDNTRWSDFLGPLSFRVADNTPSVPPGKVEKEDEPPARATTIDRRDAHVAGEPNQQATAMINDPEDGCAEASHDTAPQPALQAAQQTHRTAAPAKEEQHCAKESSGFEPIVLSMLSQVRHS
jgi:hypothetical protein